MIRFVHRWRAVLRFNRAASKIGIEVTDLIKFSFDVCNALGLDAKSPRNQRYAIGVAARSLAYGTSDARLDKGVS